MDILIRLLMVFEAIVCFLLIGIVLIQRTKGQGAGLSFGGGAEAVFGAQMGNVLTRATVVLAVLFLANTTLLTVLRPNGGGRSLADRIAKEAAAAPAAQPATEPSGDFAQQAAAVLDTMAPASTNAEAVPPATPAEAPAAPVSAPETAPAPAAPAQP